MASNRKNFFGIGLVPNTSTSTNSVPGDTEYLTSDGKLHVFGVSVNDAVVMEALAATLTNKSISGSANTISNIGNSSLTNSSITINGSSVSLGGSITVTATASNALTIGTGLTGTSYNGSAPITITIDSTVVTLTGTQTLTNKTLTAPIIATINNGGTLTLPTGPDTLIGRVTTDTLTNKTLTSPVLNTPTADTITGIAGGPLALNAVTGQTVVLEVNASPIATISSSGLAMASAKGISLANNGQIVALQASASASASYSITFPAAAPTASTGLTFNGSTFVWGQTGGWATASSTSLTGGGTVSLGTAGQQFIIVAGASGAVTLSSTPFGTSGFTDGMSIRLVGNSNTNTVSLSNNDASNGVILNGSATLFKYDMIELQYSSTFSRFLETSRNF